MRVPYAQSVHGQEEIDKVVAAIRENRLAPGPDVLRFETEVATIFGKKFGIMVNSGSSANLLALQLLDLPEGSEIITPALTFATTVAPILQHRLCPIFVDVEDGTYVVNARTIREAVTPQTRALLIPSLIGNVPNMAAIAGVCQDFNLDFIEDSCDTVGATYGGVPTGCYSHISTTSFYGSHIITAGGGGGMLCVNDSEWDTRARVLRGWGRDSAKFAESENIETRFAARIGTIDYDAKFVFSEVGYNMQSTELNAAFGLAQLGRLTEFTARRKRNFKRLHAFFQRYENLFILPRQTENTRTNWLAFPLTIRTKDFTRKQITTFLEERGIQTRPIFTGNILRQPAFEHAGSGTFPIADGIMERAFLIGCHQGLTEEQIEYMEQMFQEFLK